MRKTQETTGNHAKRETMQNQAKSSEIEPNHAKLHQIMGKHRKPRENRQNPAKQLETTLTSVQADNRYVSVSANISVIGQ